MFTERLSENPNAVTLRSVNYDKLKGLTKADHPEAGHYNFLALCNGEDFQVKIYIPETSLAPIVGLYNTLCYLFIFIPCFFGLETKRQSPSEMLVRPKKSIFLPLPTEG